jgi:hypothetical protein
MASSGPMTNHPEEDESGLDRSLDEIIESGIYFFSSSSAYSQTNHNNLTILKSGRGNEVCRDFQRGYCPRGDRCWFKHVPSETQVPENDLAAPGSFFFSFLYLIFLFLSSPLLFLFFSFLFFSFLFFSFLFFSFLFFSFLFFSFLFFSFLSTFFNFFQLFSTFFNFFQLFLLFVSTFFFLILVSEGIVANLGGRALCRDYIRGHCRRGVECPYFHVKGGERFPLFFISL